MSDVGGSGATPASRFVANAYNRVPRHVWACPAYDDNSNVNVYTSTDATWAEANGGTGNKAGYVFATPGIVCAGITARSVNSAATGQTGTGLGYDSVTSGKSLVVSYGTNGYIQAPGNPEAVEQAPGYHYLAMILAIIGGGTGTWYADIGRFGGQAADMPTTFIYGWILQ
jgi:hypothetical protein